MERGRERKIWQFFAFFRSGEDTSNHSLCLLRVEQLHKKKITFCWEYTTGTCISDMRLLIPCLHTPGEKEESIIDKARFISFSLLGFTWKMASYFRFIFLLHQLSCPPGWKSVKLPETFFLSSGRSTWTVPSRRAARTQTQTMWPPLLLLLIHLARTLLVHYETSNLHWHKLVCSVMHAFISELFESRLFPSPLLFFSPQMNQSEWRRSEITQMDWNKMKRKRERVSALEWERERMFIFLVQFVCWI